jgi:peptide deformylase
MIENMTLLEILEYPDPFLKQPTKAVTEIDDTIQTMIEDMAETMYEAPGVGLAANQAGFDKSIIVFDPAADDMKRDFQVLINPEIVDSEGDMISENEGCLSVPDFRADVKRYSHVVVEGLDRNGNPVKLEAEGLLSVIMQHEIDHLKGILFIDRISSLKRQLYKKKRLKALKSE